jgi:hypothetical protein
MPMFIDTQDGLIPVSRIQRAKVHHTDGRVALFYDGAEVTHCSAATWEDGLRKAVQAMTPAAIGTCMVQGYRDGTGAFVIDRTPVIAWAVSADGMTYPVTAEGVNDDCCNLSAVYVPNGTSGVVFRPGENSPMTFEDWSSAEQADVAAEEAAFVAPTPGQGAESTQEADDIGAALAEKALQLAGGDRELAQTALSSAMVATVVAGPGTVFVDADVDTGAA